MSEENKEEPLLLEGQKIINPFPIIWKIDENKYGININNLRLEADETFIKRMFNDAKNALNIFINDIKRI